jgi:hypothetical protein
MPLRGHQEQHLKKCDRRRQDYHNSLSVRVSCQGLLELYQVEHAVVAVGRPARDLANFDLSAVLQSLCAYR